MWSNNMTSRKGKKNLYVLVIRTVVNHETRVSSRLCVRVRVSVCEMRFFYTCVRPKWICRRSGFT